MDLLSDRIVNLAKELGCGIAMGDSSIEEREGITYGSCPDCKKTVDERARAKAIADYSNGNLNKEEPEVAPTCHICGDTMTPVTDFDSDGDGKK
jgi:hypothetical protein